MRLTLIVVGGAAVILALGGWPQQAGGFEAGSVPVWVGLPLAQDTGRASQPAPQDTAAAGVVDTAAAGVVDTAAAAADTGAAGTPPGPDTTKAAPPLAIGLERIAPPFPIDLGTGLPDPAKQRPEMRPRVRNWGEVWADALKVRAQGWKSALWLRARPVAARAREESAAGQVGEEVKGPEGAEGAEGAEGVPSREGAEAARQPAETPPTREPVPSEATPPGVAGQGPGKPQQPGELLPDVFGEYADLGLAVQGRVELGGGWNRFRPCNVAIQLNCNPSLVPTLKPDIQFGARVGGTVSDRVHVSVDYDNRREFSAANNINVYYEGLEDEILQRVEVGDVSFPLPQSQYLTQGIPAGNFGFRTTGQMGPVDFQAVWAQQKGDLGTRELQLGGGGQGFEQTATTILDDADYETGRFYFLFNPRRLNGYPHVDIQRLIASDAPPDVRPGSVVKVYRYEVIGLGLGNQIPEGFITAVAAAVDTLKTELGADTVVTDTLSGLFRPLVEGEDYVLHQSGLWLQLRNTLSDQEGLAVTYIAADGHEVGTFNAEAASDAHNANPESVPPPTLELIKGLNTRPGTATWSREMHQIYRVSASPGVVQSSVELIVSQGDPEVGNTFRAAADGTQVEFIKIFGLDDDPTDNKLDQSRIYEVGGGAGATSGPSGTYIVFPTLEPFELPPPIKDVPGLSGQPFPLDPGDQNRAIYDEPNDQVRRGTNLYLLTIRYRQRFEGFLSTISLGVGGVRDGSERVMIDNQELVRGEDYTIDYDVGQIELREPERWFASNPNARVRVTFEQKPLFQLAPTTVFGLQARYSLGERGELNFIGLSQTEKTLQTRPELGLEPSAVRLGGFSGRLNFRPSWLTSLVNALPGVERSAPSSINMDGEIALSAPSTNTQGVTYVEDFEGGPGFNLNMLSRAWRLGSAPSTAAGAEFVAPAAFAADNAAELVWQDQYFVQTADGELLVGGLRPSDIDNQILIQGQQRPEPVLTITARRPENRQIGPNPNPPPGPAWGSLTSVLSSSGQDFTNIEFLEFYVAVSDELADSTSLIVDLGTVSEDAFAIDSLGLPSGLGVMNREVDPPEVWSNADDVGLWGRGCEAELGRIAYALGDVDANCTRGNGLEDSEDLNQNRILDTEERFFRYTIELGDPTSRYFVREANELAPGVRFRLYRIPLRQPDHRERVTDAEFQNIRHLRFTWVTRTDNRIILARARFVGSRFLKRGQNGVVEGLTDSATVVAPGAQVEIGPISTVDPRYVPPPGVTDLVANRTDQLGFGGQAFNEQSLKIRFNEIGLDQRAEVYLQYPQTPRDFLAYRSLLVWALGIEGPWGREGKPLQFLVKLGEDGRDFYMFRTPLTEVPAGAGDAEIRQAWQPEIEIDFRRFIALRAKAEEIMLKAGGLPGDSALELWDVDVFEDGDSSYAIVISQRSRAPNLASVRQVSLGVYNASSTLPVSGELWVDDMRLTAPVDNAGVVGRFNLDVRGSDVLGFRVNYSSENPYFRQLAQAPQFRSSRTLGIGGNLQFGRLLPQAWGVNFPIALSYTRSSSTPLLLPRTDVFVEALPGLRTPDNKNLRFDLGLSRRSSGRTPWVGWLVDNSSVRFSYDRRSSQSSRSKTESSSLSFGYSYRSDVADLSLPLFPGKNWRLRLSPQSLQFNTSYADSKSEIRRFQEIIALPGDSAAVPITALDERLLSNATVNFEPITSLTGRVSATEARELVPANQLVAGGAARRLINRERSRLLGVDLGWETGRTIDVNWTYRPRLATWLIPQATLDTRFRLSRGASFVAVQAGDTVLTSDFNSARTVRLSAGFNAPALLRDVFGRQRSGVLEVLLGVLDRLDIFTASWTDVLSSRFQRQTARPRLGYQFGFGGFDRFRVQGADTASNVTDGELVTLSSGVRLPLGIGVNFDFSRNDQLLWTPITQNKSHRVSWPGVNVNWNRIPLPAFLNRWVSSFGVRGGYTRQTSRNEVLNANQTRLQETKTIPFSVNLALTTEWTLSYSRTLSEQERRDPTGVTIGDLTTQQFQLTGRVRPLSRQGTFQNPVRLSLRFSQDDQKQCRQLGAAFAPGGSSESNAEALPSCEPFTDRRIRTVDLTVATDVPPFSLGLQGSWRDTQSEIGQRPGSTQLEISVFGQFLLETGEIR